MPMFEYDGQTDAFSASHPSPRCAGVCCPNPRSPAGVLRSDTAQGTA